MSRQVEPERGSETDGEASDDAPLLELDGVTKHFSNDDGLLSRLSYDPESGGLPFGLESEQVRAVEDVSLTIEEGETLGLVGESGCGKSTLARTVLQLLEPTAGDVYYRGENLAEMDGDRLREVRKDVQMIFQASKSSLDPRMKVGSIIEEPMQAHDLPESNPDVTTTADVTDETRYETTVDVDDDVDMAVATTDGVATVHVTVRDGDGEDPVAVTAEDPHLGTEVTVDEAAETVAVRVLVTASKDDLRRSRARELLEKVGLDPQHYNRYPHAFSGGQRQRINLARALSVDPDFVVCDEPVSALDVSIQAQVLNTMRDLQEEFGLTYLFIAHDLSVIRHISDRVAVMYLGQLAEVAHREELFENPKHPYTEALLDAIPVPDPRADGARSVLEGEVPSPIDPPSGCRFRTRCPVLIAPEAYDLDAERWDEVRTFMRQVDRRQVGVTPERFVRREYFPDGFPRGEAGDAVTAAVRRVSNGEWDAAADRLDELSEATLADLPEHDREAVAAFRDDVERQAVSLDAAERIRNNWFPDGLPDGEAGEHVRAAIDALAAEDWERASDRLQTAFAEQSPCATAEPAYDVPTEFGDDAFVACHRQD